MTACCSIFPARMRRFSRAISSFFATMPAAPGSCRARVYLAACSRRRSHRGSTRSLRRKAYRDRCATLSRSLHPNSGRQRNLVSLQNRERITYGSSRSLPRALLPDRPQPQPNMEEVRSQEPRMPVLQRLRRSARHDRGCICYQRRQRLAVSIQPLRDIRASYRVFSQMRAVAVHDITNQLSFGRIAPTTSFVRRHNLIFCAATPTSLRVTINN